MNIERWRLILGDASAGVLGDPTGDAAERDDALEWLYGRDPARSAQGVRAGTSRLQGTDSVTTGDNPGGGDTPGSPGAVPPSRKDGRYRPNGLGETTVTAVDWLDDIHRLFPRETVHRLERDAVEKYEITEVVTDLEALQRIEPSVTLLRAVLRTKHLMDPRVLAMAKKAVDNVVRELIERLSVDVRRTFHGKRSRHRTAFRNSRNFDFEATVRANLQHWSPQTRKIAIEKPLFTSRTRRHTDTWTLILLVDQSGSMIDSVIHSAITAACFWNVPGLRTHLIAYDTNVVDLTSEVLDPVELLMSVQLGGGNDGAKAVDYAAQLVDRPQRTIVVIISDLYESAPDRFVRSVAGLTDNGVRVLALAALDDAGDPDYDREIARRLTRLGVHVGAMTPGGLAEFVAGCIR
ncbi:VWA domain-containing protein [Rhodococcus erythropolis]|jgi:Mg-chelatase subunit ChlD|uniref:Uncharacterized protein n=1 Tax=Rhodococcus erythropolis TaxID=1833 RepID=A0A1F2Q5L7_RHOER|nr:VWA domain-containing protein [Rhodococcus erythropolis]KAB2584969.1 hypothetical protein BS297_12810 [Rhodococcus erythropolis]MDF2468559.1 hypothetical protein [Rhodococcus erythropolis]OFV79323.1 VWA domain containing CoxE-like protein [Rhodococcus erythropolis]ORI30993.1 hypothetical protein BH686_11805 [Rhodococcus erythropolis]